MVDDSLYRETYLRIKQVLRFSSFLFFDPRVGEAAFIPTQRNHGRTSTAQGKVLVHTTAWLPVHTPLTQVVPAHSNAPKQGGDGGQTIKVSSHVLGWRPRIEPNFSTGYLRDNT